MRHNLPSEPRLETDRLILRLADDADVPAIVDYYRRNREHLRPYDPARTESFFAEEFWYSRVRQDHQELTDDRALRLFLFPRREPRRIMGVANFTQIVRGVAQYCTLGYNIDRDEQGKGLMQEALRAGISYVFVQLRIHRIQANYMPHNRRSGALLRRLGFVVEGYARDYLLIDGRWEDHILTSLTNDRVSPAPPRPGRWG